MAEPIGPGDWVECIDASVPVDPPLGAQHLVLGALYCVDQVRLSPRTGNTGFVLCGLPKSKAGRLVIYLPYRFRPIRDGQERIVKPEKVTAHDC